MAAKKISLHRKIIDIHTIYKRMIFLSLVIHTMARWTMAINRFDDCSVSSLINLRMDAATIISQAFEKGTTILRPYIQPWTRCETDKKRHFIIMISTWTAYSCFALSLSESNGIEIKTVIAFQIFHIHFLPREHFDDLRTYVTKTYSWYGAARPGIIGSQVSTLTKILI